MVITIEVFKTNVLYVYIYLNIDTRTIYIYILIHELKKFFVYLGLLISKINGMKIDGVSW